MKEQLFTKIEEAMLSSFGCFRAEEEIRGYLQEAAKVGATWEEFVENYLSKFGTCECRTDSCTWSPEAIVERLEERGLLNMFQEYLAESAEGWLASSNANLPQLSQLPNI